MRAKSIIWSTTDASLELGRAWHLPQLGERDERDGLRFGSGPVRDEPGPQQQRAGLLECIVEELAPGW